MPILAGIFKYVCTLCTFTIHFRTSLYILGQKKTICHVTNFDSQKKLNKWTNEQTHNLYIEFSDGIALTNISTCAGLCAAHCLSWALVLWGNTRASAFGCGRLGTAETSLALSCSTSTGAREPGTVVDTGKDTAVPNNFCLPGPCSGPAWLLDDPFWKEYMTKLSSYLCSSQKSFNSFSSELCLDGKLFKYSQENSMLVTIVVNCHINLHLICNVQ